MEAYRQTRNKVNKLNTNVKRQFFTNKISSHNGDLKKTWEIINVVLNKRSKTTHIAALQVDGRQICDYESIAESMNDLFLVLAIPLATRYLSFIHFHFNLFIHGYPVNRRLLFRGPGRA